jgi:hypothetical protein
LPLAIAAAEPMADSRFFPVIAKKFPVKPKEIPGYWSDDFR